MADRLELALARADSRFDPVSYLSAQRSMLTAAFEFYCAAGLLVGADGEGLDIGLGLGCLLGATVTSIMAYRGFVHPRAPAQAELRLSRFRRARRGPFSESLPPDPSFGYLETFEAELRAQARRDRRRRIVTGILGILELGATAVVAGLTARGRIDRNTGTAVAAGTAMVGTLGVIDFGVRSPSEQALSLYDAGQ